MISIAARLARVWQSWHEPVGGWARRSGAVLVQALVAGILSLSVGAVASEPAPYREAIAFVGVHVIPMNEERVLRDMTVVVRGGRIDTIAPSAELTPPDDVKAIDGRGRYLMPGLGEMHAHIPGPPERARSFPGAHDPRGVENTLFLFVANGVTTVRGMLGDPYHLQLRERVAAGELIGPAIYTAGMGLFSHNVPDREAAEREVHEQHEAGFDFLKVFEIPADVYAHMAGTASQVAMPFAGHIPSEVGLEGALEHGQHTIDHLDRYVEYLAGYEADGAGGETGFFGSALVGQEDASRLVAAATKTRDAGVWNVPTLTLVENLASPVAAETMAEVTEMRYMPREVIDHWVAYKNDLQAQEHFQPDAAERLVALRREIVGALHDAGALLALGSDAPQHFNVPGFSVHAELQALVDSGLTPYEALATGTYNVGLLLGERGELGVVEEGLRADLILLEANPLEDIGNTRKLAGVMVQGRWLSAADIEGRLDEIAADYREE